ncbi:hypothetical protein HFK18_16765|uniref:hypothetical protein n=1 Tax=Stenotrophomonas TaxID=40323 RepID=UPI0015D2501B|nr:hypothetical protein [Stenotrophomonas sp. SbOxS2]NYU00127.1 hypothetical protein [Stenotrophomonas sp. SbOxS2]
MSEPYSALLRLRLPRERLARWLAAPVPAASRWKDWRSIAGRWRLPGGADLAASSDVELGEFLADCNAMLARHADNRAALAAILQSAQAENIKLAAYDQAGACFVAGSLTYSENLHDLVVFLAMARGAADFLEPGEHGEALVHDYLWAEDGERETVAAVHLAGKGDSGFMTPAQSGETAATFDAMVELMLEGADDPQFTPRNQLDRIQERGHAAQEN